jgi:hypothetical protein
MTPLAFLRHVDWAGVHDVALVQTGSARQVLDIAVRLRAEFPAASIQAILDEDTTGLVAVPGLAVEVARPGHRWELLRRLRAKRFDLVVVQLGDEPMGELGRLAFLLRARSMMAFNQNLDSFPVNVHRVATIAQHFGGDGRGGGALVGWALRRVASAAFVTPVASARLALRVARRRLRGPRSRASVLADAQRRRTGA